jgi:3-hydroxy-9,10-secoandrosta-1,3,5(10)-triene-9,17-dione monooxygenase
VTGVAIPAPGGYNIQGTWDYASGCDVATHFLGACLVTNPETKTPAGVLIALFDRADYTIVDNWNVFGMQGTGSKRVVIEQKFVPESHVLHWVDGKLKGVRHQPGHALHANRLYHGPIVPLLISAVAAVCVGAARGALDIYEESLIDTAEAALLHMAGEYMQLGVDASEDDGRRLFSIEQHCVRMAWEAVELMFQTAGSSAATNSAPLGRYFRNLAVVRTHLTLQLEHTAANLARTHFGLPALSRL